MKITAFRAWLILLALQALIAQAIFSKFFAGEVYFAYLDIGSDSYGQYVPYAMHMARTFVREGFSGWSFEFGLGGLTFLPSLTEDIFTVMSQLGGPDNVLPLRIWVYLLKIMLGGTSFFLLIRCFVTRWENAVVTALAYSFCGFIVINGQWDVEATAFVFFPLIIWVIAKHLRTGSVIALPLVLAVSLASGVFFVSVGVFLLFTGVAFILTSSEPRAMLKSWLTRILPLALIGYLLAAPILLPIMFQMMDSSRVGGGQALFEKIWQQSLSVNDWPLILTEIGGLFHKDIFGIGSAYRGYWNYLEGPGFFIGVLLFLVIPQLWNGTVTDRKVLLISLAGVVAYFVFPVFRHAAMGFAVPYFRVSTLWVSLVLLLLAARAVDQVIKNGVNGRLLAVGVGSYALLLALVLRGSMGTNVWAPHVVRILGLAVLASVLLLLAQRKLFSARLLPLALLGVTMIEIVVIAGPSYFAGRSLATPGLHAYDDGTPDALRRIRAIDKGVFRIEKTYHSVSLADALAQDYMGVKSYSFHSRGLVDFNVGLGLIPPSNAGMAVNYTNWLPNVGQRFMLNTLLGVKYIITKVPVQWPGFVAVDKDQPGYQIYRNDLALPLGVVQTRQITQSAFARLATLPTADANIYRDVAVINAVVVESLVPEHGEPFNLDELLRSTALSLQVQYFEPAKILQDTGLQIERFASNHITGKITPRQAGILVFSIPFNQGWSLMIDGNATPLIRANFGMLAAPVQAGAHRVELNFLLPGLRVGIFGGVLGLGLLALAVALTRRRKNM